MADQFAKITVGQVGWLAGGAESEYARLKNEPTGRTPRAPHQRPLLARTVGEPCTGLYPDEGTEANTFWVVTITGTYPAKQAGSDEIDWTDLQSADSAQFTAHNINEPGWVPEGTEVVIIHDNNKWWFQATGSAEGTTSTTTPQPDCSGECQWQWVEADGEWTLLTDACGAAAATTTTASPITTTTVACSTTTAPSTTSTTTTAAPSCSCLYPTYCGTFDGEATTTQCSSGSQDPNTSCPPTTTSTTTSEPTTTCPPTTTTGAPAQCTAGCEWVGSPFGWLMTSNGCNPVCACPTPPGSPVLCETYSTPCVIQPPTTAPPPPTCGGTCDYWCSAVGGDWTLISHDCTGVAAGCQCAAPSGECDECGPLQVSCITPGTSTSTTIDPCDPTTPPPTTTTKGPCTDCKWVYDLGADDWYITEDNCTDGCPCLSPTGSGFIGGETAVVPCGPETTTTAGPTTTTTTAAPTTTTTTQPCETTDCLLQCVNGFYVIHTDCDSPCVCEGLGDQCTEPSGETAWSSCALATTTTTCNPATDGATWTCGIVALCPELPPSWKLTNNCCPGRIPDSPAGTCDCSTQDAPENVSCGDPVSSTTTTSSSTTTTTSSSTTTTTT